MEYTSDLVPRILRDIDNSVLALDGHGHIIYMNPQCRALLTLDDTAIGRTYAEVFFDEQKRKTTHFISLLSRQYIKKSKYIAAR